jgi:hypothetical protein
MTIDGNLKIVEPSSIERTKREEKESNVYDRRGRSRTPVADDEECCYES